MQVQEYVYNMREKNFEMFEVWKYNKNNERI